MNVLRNIKSLVESKAINKVSSSTNSVVHISDNMKKHIEKYEETYKLLEEYDKKFIKNSEILADAGRLRVSFERIQSDSGKGRTNSAV